MEQIYRKIKMLASTIQFSHNTTRNHTNHKNRSRQATSAQKEKQTTNPTHTTNKPRTQGSRRCLPRHPTAHRHTHKHFVLKTAPCGRQASTQKHATPRPASTGQPTQGGRLDKKKLLRKEVIQPHLPVRLPCYDFVPITDPTFDSSPHKGWATGFGCYRLS